MPLYTYRCNYCGMEATEFRHIEYRDNAPNCDCRAWEPMKRIISAPMVRPDYAGYTCPITNEWIEGKKAHEENLKKHGCRVMESGDKESVERFRKESDKKLEKAIEESVGKTLDNMPPERLRVMQEGVEKVSIGVERG